MSMSAPSLTKQDLVQTVERLVDRVDDLEDELQAEKAKNRALSTKVESTKQAVSEIQSRELEKGAHLREDNVDEYEVDVDGGRLERISKEDGGSYFRIPESEDPIGRGGETTLAHSDLLPIQQLAQMDEDILKQSTSTKQDYYAVKLWQERDKQNGVWSKGGNAIREYIDAGEIHEWLYIEQIGRDNTSESAARKLADRTIESLKELTRHRIKIKKVRSGRSGVTSKERRIMIEADAEIPGETDPTPVDKCRPRGDVSTGPAQD
jgi:hypothetical protein